MVTLISALGACTSRMTSGDRRLAERLEHKLNDDLLWYDVSVGLRQLHPGFIVLHPSRGRPIVEVKDLQTLALGGATARGSAVGAQRGGAGVVCGGDQSDTAASAGGQCNAVS